MESSLPAILTILTKLSPIIAYVIYDWLLARKTNAILKNEGTISRGIKEFPGAPATRNGELHAHIMGNLSV
jgi:hypothetical protein